VLSNSSRKIFLLSVPIYFAFTAGIIAAFNPCGMAMFPAYVGYQIGSISGSNSVLRLTITGLTRGVAVTLGFVTVFGSLGLILAIGGKFIAPFLPFLGLGVGIGITLVALWMLYQKRTLALPGLSGFEVGTLTDLPSTFLFGIAYALASVSCALPIFLAAIGIVVGSGLTVGTFLNVVLGSLSYSLGMGIVMTGVTLSALFFENSLSRIISRATVYVDILGKIAMLSAGIYLIWYWLMGDGRIILELRVDQLIS